jgi:non-ribosomal peptide synthetase component F
VSKSLDTKEFENTSVDLDIPYSSLETFARKYKLDVAAVLRVAWSLVLRAYVGSDSACFGYRTSGRDIPVAGLPGAVGCFSTVLPCRLAVHSSQFLAQLLLDSEEIHREALDHQCVSVSHIHHALQLKSVSLFNTCLSFGYENNSQESSANVEFQHVKSMQASEYDINVDIALKNGNITLDVGHRILTSDQATNLAHAFGRAIHTIVEVPGGQVKDADLFSEHDHQQIITWNSQSKNVPKQHISQARENSDVQAVCSWDGNLTYGELNELSTTLASHLVCCGVTHQTPVPVIVEKGRWAVVAMLAVLK